jgi:hypothetical protein
MNRILAITILALSPTFAIADDTVTIKGQAFVQTIDSGPMKLAAMKVYAFPISALSAFPDPSDIVDPTKTVNLPKPWAVTSTDVEGHFTLKVENDQPFFIFANGGYYTRKGRFIAFEWRVPLASIDDRDNLVLQNNNAKTPQQKVEIATE